MRLRLFLALHFLVWRVECGSGEKRESRENEMESAFPRRSCSCDIGIVDHIMILPVHEKSRPLKNCAVAVEYCKQMCAPAVTRQILGFREFVGLNDVAFTIKPFWESQRSLGDALCHSLALETSKPLDLAVYSQAKSCGRRIQALNGTFNERLCCAGTARDPTIRYQQCPPRPTTTTTTLPTTSKPTQPPTKRKTSKATTTTKKRTSRRSTTTTTEPTTTTVNMMPEMGEMRDTRLRQQFIRFIQMLRTPN